LDAVSIVDHIDGIRVVSIGKGLGDVAGIPAYASCGGDSSEDLGGVSCVVGDSCGIAHPDDVDEEKKTAEGVSALSVGLGQGTVLDVFIVELFFLISAHYKYY
jgi:hypothetical protein